MNEEHVILYGSKRTCGRIELKKVATIKDRMEFKLQRGTSKVNLKTKITIEAERLTLEKGNSSCQSQDQKHIQWIKTQRGSQFCQRTPAVKKE